MAALGSALRQAYDEIMREPAPYWLSELASEVALGLPDDRG